MKSYYPSQNWHSTSFLLLIIGSSVCGCDAPKTKQSTESSKVPKSETAQAEQPSTAKGTEEPKPTPMRMTDDAFRFAAYEGKLEDVRQGIAAGNNVNSLDPERALTPLHMAAFNGHTSVVKLLLEHGALVDAKDNEGKTPLLHACTGPFPETVEVLIAANADINVKEATEAFTPLMMAAGLGQVEVVKLLLRHNADKAVLDNDGDTALQHAKNSGHATIVEILE